MSKNLNISVLVSARDEYIQQLKCIMIPLLIQGYNSIYQDALQITNGKNVIYKFQELLKEIPNWNQTILQEESKRIKKKCNYIMDIVTAIFVTNVKILASVRLKGSKDDIRVKIPTSDIFIHGIYIEAAQHIFYDPFLFYHKNGNRYGDIQKNKQSVRDIICSSIDETIRRMLPFDDILQKYLADALNNNAEFDSESNEEEEVISDSDEESINNDDLPSDEESEPESREIKSFNIGKNETTFIEPPTLPTLPTLPPQQFLSTEQSFEPTKVDSFVLPNPVSFVPPNKPDSDSDDSGSESSGSGSSVSSYSSSSSSSSGEQKHQEKHTDHEKHKKHSKHEKHKKKYSFF